VMSLVTTDLPIGSCREIESHEMAQNTKKMTVTYLCSNLSFLFSVGGGKRSGIKMD
jgi:hypothetical protein